MWRALGVFLVFQLLSGLCSGVTVMQKEKFIAIQNGSKGSIPCEHNDSSYYIVLWYQQKKGAERQLQLVATSSDVNSAEMEKEFKTRFKVTRPATLNTSLTINPGMVEDTAVYFCAARNGNSERQYFGDGTKLTVLEDVSKITDPKVAIFPPSKQEIKEKRKATLVCLVTGFYPDHIKLVWWVNGVERKEGVRTDESLMDKNKEKYSLTSRLRLSLQEWSNPKNVFHCHVEFYGNKNKTYDEVISGVADCSVSEESYLRSAMAGKSVYVLLIFKSALYGVFVMGLMLRNKQVQ